MTVVAAYVYKNGQRDRTIDIHVPADLQLAVGEFAWVGLYEPDADELKILAERFDLHPLAVEDALVGYQPPKVDVYGEQIFVVAKTAFLEDNEHIRYGETHIFLGPRHIITVRHGSARSHDQLRAQLEANPILLRHGVDYVLHAILDFIVDGYPPIVEAIEEDVLAIEKRALDAFLRRDEVNHLFKLRRELTRFRRLLGPMEEVISRFDHHDMPCIDKEVRPYFHDVRDHIRRAAVLVDGLKETLASVFEVATLLEQQRQSEITRRLAAGAAILAVPTAIAGIYGMNFEFMPELHWRYGYPVALAVIIGTCIFLYWQFKKSRWF